MCPTQALALIPLQVLVTQAEPTNGEPTAPEMVRHQIRCNSIALGGLGALDIIDRTPAYKTPPIPFVPTPPANTPPPLCRVEAQVLPEPAPFGEPLQIHLRFVNDSEDAVSFQATMLWLTGNGGRVLRFSRNITVNVASNTVAERDIAPTVQELTIPYRLAVSAPSWVEVPYTVFKTSTSMNIFSDRTIAGVDLVRPRGMLKSPPGGRVLRAGFPTTARVEFTSHYSEIVHDLSLQLDAGGALATNIPRSQLTSAPTDVAPGQTLSADFPLEPTQLGWQDISGGFDFGLPSDDFPRWLVVCQSDYNADQSINPDDIGDYISDFFTSPPAPGPGGYAVPCPQNAPPYDQGYRANFNESCDPPNPDQIGDFITAYFLQHCA